MSTSAPTSTATSSRLIDDEILLRPSGRLALFPIMFPKAWDFYKKAQGCTWTAEEITFSKDLAHWEGLHPDIQRVVKTVLGFFSGADRIVNINLAENMMRRIDIPEVQCFYAFQNHIENVHNETYSLMIDNLIRDPAEKKMLFNACDTMPGISKLYDWARKWIHRTKEDEMNDNPVLHEYQTADAPDEVIEDLAEIWVFCKTLVANACIEGIAFSGAFAIIFFLKERGILPGLTFSNELISRDEGMHRDFACYMYSLIRHKPPVDQVLEIVLEAVSAKQELIAGCMERLPGMNREDMFRYIEYVADSLLVQLGLPRHFNVANPFDFMEKISFNGITNFFERRVGEYGVSGFEEGNADPIELDEHY